jgi:AGZA family xanthine/uracil permease-like MFS transporter
MSFQGVMTATVILAFAMSLMMGLYAKLPFAVAPGMGVNAFFTYTVILGNKVPWQQALGIVFWAGVLFLLISLTPLRQMVALAIPPGLRVASATGIGIFLTFIGLKNSGFIVADADTLVRFGSISKEMVLTMVGIAIIVVLMKRKNPLAFLLSIIVITLLAWCLGMVKVPSAIVSLPDFRSTFFQLDIFGALKLALVPTMIGILFTDLFDSISTFIGVSYATGLIDEKGDPKNLRQGLIVDAWATLTAGLFGTSSGTAYIESSAGIEMGGRTGRAAVVTALCFLPCLFIAPLASMVPACATASVLILVGALMFKSAVDLPMKHIEDIIPAFLTVVLIPLSFSITQGILWGFISHVALYYMVGRRREVSKILLVIALISVGLIALENYK